jgi:thioredoxin 1
MNIIPIAASFLFLACAGAFGQPKAMPDPPSDSSQQLADRIVNSKKPVFIDFWAVWCGPCRMLNPVIKQLEEEYKGRVEFMKINVDVHRSIAQYFGISGIPAVFIVKDKAVINGMVGLRPIADYQAALKAALAPRPKIAAQPPAAAPAPAKPASPAPRQSVE